MKPKAIFVGRLTRDTTSIYKNPDGSAKRALFTVACNSTYKGADNQKIKQVAFIPCIAWGSYADLLEKWGLKGRQVSIVGTIESYQKPPDNDGEYEPTKIQVRISEIEFLDFEDNVREKFEAEKKASVQVPAEGSTNLTPENLMKALQTLLSGAQPQQQATATTPPEYEEAVPYEEDVPY